MGTSAGGNCGFDGCCCDCYCSEIVQIVPPIASMTLLKRSNHHQRREGRPLLIQAETPVLSDSYEGGEGGETQQKQPKKSSWKLKFHNKKSNQKTNSKQVADELFSATAWEPPAPSILAPVEAEQPPQPQPQQPIRIQDNETTVKSLTLSSSSSSMIATVTNEDHQQQQQQRIFHNNNSNNEKKPQQRLPSASTILARPFGREGLLLKDFTVRFFLSAFISIQYLHTSRHLMNSSLPKWMVQVGAAEWTNGTWNYRITVQEQRQQPDFVTNGFTLRTLADFAWLEQALQLECHGGLLVPSLSISLGIPHDLILNCTHEVDSKALAFWLSDVLNGIRGQGELCFHQNQVNLSVIDSEAVEAFLYRSQLVDMLDDYSHMEHTPNKKKNENYDNPNHDRDDPQYGSAWDWMDICGTSPSYTPTNTTAAANQTTTTTTTAQSSRPSPSKKKMLFQKDTVSSKALGDSRTFQLQNSFVESSPTFDLGQSPSSIAAHLPLIQAERDLVWMWRTRALTAMESLRKLKEQEKTVGSAWKRFAISISNLFSFEKEIEAANSSSTSTFGKQKRGKLQNPYRRLHKSTVDDCLRTLANAKMERSIPGLDTLEIMLHAYIADLSTVHPSVEVYLEGLHTVSMIAHEQKQQQQEQSSEEKKTTDPQDVAVIKFLSNETVLKRNLTILCQTAPVRTSRMAHKFFHKEYQQSQDIQKSAETMKSKINVASKEGLAKIIHRHLTEEKEDRISEVALVQRVVAIGSSSSAKFLSPDQQNTQEVEKGVELSKEDENEEAANALKRDNALLLCRERIGRWDAKLAMAIMEAVGVTDANVRVEETTRELRLVRKYAIGLREHLQRCMEALEYLQFCVNGQDTTNMRLLRHNFMTELQTIFSTTYLSKENNLQLPVDVLQKHAIHLRDPSGWLQRSVGSCGGDLATYLNAREAGSEWLVNSLGDLLKDYNQRVEAVESFVYMECAGIQLEKHFSQSRATALAAFEKKTDITSAINIATRKRMPQLVRDLQAKLETVGADVSHTTVKAAKEAHLESKALKQELSDLGMRRLTRTRETSTERVIALMTVWSREEEGSSSAETKALKKLMQSLEQRVRENDLKAYLDASPSPQE